MILFYLIFWATLVTIGDIFAKIGANDNNKWYYILAYILYCVGVIFFFLTLKEKNLAVANAIFVGFNAITLVIASWSYFHDTISILHLIAIWLILAGVIILQFT